MIVPVQTYDVVPLQHTVVFNTLTSVLSYRSAAGQPDSMPSALPMSPMLTLPTCSQVALDAAASKAELFQHLPVGHVR